VKLGGGRIAFWWLLDRPVEPGDDSEMRVN
jgi:hypothetical protein